MVKNLPANSRDATDSGSIPRSGRSTGGGHRNPLQYSCLENPMDREAWWAIVHRVKKSWTQLKRLSMYASCRIWVYQIITFYTKAMATHSSTLAWKIPWMEEPGGLQSMGSWRVRHDWATSPSLFTSMHWRRKWQLTPVFLPGESQGRGSLVGCRLWGHTEWDTIEAT